MKINKSGLVELCVLQDPLDDYLIVTDIKWELFYWLNKECNMEHMFYTTIWNNYEEYYSSFFKSHNIPWLQHIEHLKEVFDELPVHFDLLHDTVYYDRNPFLIPGYTEYTIKNIRHNAIHSHRISYIEKKLKENNISMANHYNINMPSTKENIDLIIAYIESIFLPY